MAEASSGFSAKLDRYDGSDPSIYKRWRRRATIMLMSLPNTYPPEKHVAKLMEYLTGDAELFSSYGEGGCNLLSRQAESPGTSPSPWIRQHVPSGG